MSIVIIGGHDRMVGWYQQLCKKYHCSAKIFTHMPARLKEQIGTPDAMVVFLSTVSHKMVRCATEEAQRKKIQIIHCAGSSKTALEEVLKGVLQNSASVS